ncbi:sensor domain-containing diguanylate cyclase [Pelagibacterium limicola]|uniref:sensor domain-containing diguanylate cyclase n=1 Tax=Pelagibacterium limicola TaxID=2791022 RepID=UPI0018AF8C40|nr:sensor domain-containing diguanylate cyclase [Pelagibacterium limicola]
MVRSSKAKIPKPARELIRRFGLDPIGRLLEGIASSPIPMALFDPQDRLAYHCPNFAKLYAVPDGPQTFASLIRNCHATRQGPIIEADDIEAWIERAHARRRSVPHRRFEIDYVDGSWYQALETTFDDGWVIVMLFDLTALKAKEVVLTTACQAAEAEARTDDLTGLSSRRAIMHYLEAAIRPAIPGAPLTIALLDLDHFKQINDTLGHDMGDEVLRLLGRHLADASRDPDRAGRVGGEEFLLVMPGKSTVEAWQIMQRLRRDWQRKSRLLPPARPVTFSVGIAQQLDGQPARALYRAADYALYRAKYMGRDRVVCADGPIPHLPGPLTAEPPRTATAGHP